MGYSDLGCYGGEIETPHLDSIAQKGLRFTEFYNTARCWPTRAALLSGYYAQQVRRDSLPGVKRGNRPSWAHLLPAKLKPSGYRSYHSGNWSRPRISLGSYLTSEKIALRLVIWLAGCQEKSKNLRIYGLPSRRGLLNKQLGRHSYGA